MKTEVYYKLYNATKNTWYGSVEWETKTSYHGKRFSSVQQAKSAMARKLNRVNRWASQRPGYVHPVNAVLGDDWEILKFVSECNEQMSYVSTLDPSKLRSIVNAKADKIHPTVIVALKQKGLLVPHVRKARTKKNG